MECQSEELATPEAKATEVGIITTSYSTGLRPAGTDSDASLA